MFRSLLVALIMTISTNSAMAETDMEVYNILSHDVDDGKLEYPCSENVPDYSGWCESTEQVKQYSEYGILQVYESKVSYEVHCTGPRKKIHQVKKEDILKVCSQKVVEIDVIKEELEDELGQEVEYILLENSIILTLEYYGTLEVVFVNPPMFITAEYLSKLIWEEIE